MKLEASSVGENGIGMDQVESQLTSLTIQLQELAKGKEKHQEVWCTTFRKECHHKNECPTFQEYLAAGAPNPLARGGWVWCEIFRILSHHLTTCPLMHKYQRTKKIYFVIFTSQ
jgi:hypothetical protein